MEDLKVLEYIKEKTVCIILAGSVVLPIIIICVIQSITSQRIEEEQKSEAEKLKAEKEREIARLRAQQERAKDKQSEKVSVIPQ